MLFNFLLLTGTIIGAGIFSLPFIFQKLSFFYPVLLFILTIISIYLSFTYLKIIKSIKEKHQLPGYLAKTLGVKWGRVSSFLLLFSTGGALLAYLILGGQFVGNIWTYYLIAAGLFLLKPQLMEQSSNLLTTILFLALIFLIILGVSPIKFSAAIFTPKTLLEGYGAILFALTGFSVLPELDYKQKNIKLTILLSYFVIFILYLFFGILVKPTQSLLFNLVGFLAITTSYLPLSLVFEDTLIKDLKLKYLPAKLVTLFLPLVLYSLGLHNFLAVLAFTGAVFLGSLAVLIFYGYLKIKKTKGVAETLIIFAASAFFLLGLLGEVIINLF